MSSEGRLACASCGGAYTVDGGSGADGQVVLRCGACGAEVTATLVLGHSAKAETEGANASASQPPARASAPPAAEASKRSAAALLDETPPSRERRFSLLAEAPILPPPKSVPPVAAAARMEPEVVSREDISISSSSLVDALPSERQLEEIASDELVEAPPSVRIAAAELVSMASKAPPPPPMSKAPPPPTVSKAPPPPPPMSKAPPPPTVSKAPPPPTLSKAPSPHVELAEDDDDDGKAEPVSLKEVTIVPSTPHAPRAGELRTLPPSAMSAPPPTIEVPSRPPPASVRPAKGDARPQPASEGQSPFVWITLTAAAVAVAWLALRGSGPGQTSTTGGDGARASEGSPKTSGQPTASAVLPLASGSAPPSPVVSARVVVAEPTELVTRPGTTASGSSASGAGAGVAGGGGTIADLLERASRARHAGDLPKARAFYTQALAAHPGDVEASSGLGEVSRMSGDLAGAKRHFQDALAASPTFYPALLGLGDTLWELGDKYEAQRIYARLLTVRDAVPERVRDRAQPGGAAAKPAPRADPEPPPPVETPAPAPTAGDEAPKAE